MERLHKETVSWEAYQATTAETTSRSWELATWLLDLALMDYFLWCYMKAKVYKVKPWTRQKLIEWLSNVAQAVKENLNVVQVTTTSFSKPVAQ